MISDLTVSFIGPCTNERSRWCHTGCCKLGWVASLACALDSFVPSFGRQCVFFVFNLMRRWVMMKRLPVEGDDG